MLDTTVMCTLGTKVIALLNVVESHVLSISYNDTCNKGIYQKSFSVSLSEY